MGPDEKNDRAIADEAGLVIETVIEGKGKSCSGQLGLERERGGSSQVRGLRGPLPSGVQEGWSWLLFTSDVET